MLMPPFTKRHCIDCDKPLPRHNRITTRCRRCQGKLIAPTKDPTTYIKKVEKRVAKAEQKNALTFDDWKMDKIIITPQVIERWLSKC
jgi:hypothetical protein